jgi:hypothetical protein
MNGIIIDERAVRALIHHFRHMDSVGLIPESVLSMEFINTAGNKMSYRRLVGGHRERLSSVVKYLELCLESQPAESSNAETLAQHTTQGKTPKTPPVGEICPDCKSPVKLVPMLGADMYGCTFCEWVGKLLLP